MSEQPAPRVAIVGGNFGAWLARAAVRNGGDVTLITRRSAEHSHDRLHVTGEVSRAADCPLVVLAVPSGRVDPIAQSLAGVLDGTHAVVHVIRGFLDDALRTPSEVFVRATACRRVGVLGGPLGRSVLVDGNPGGGLIGSEYPDVVTLVRSAFGSARFRVDSSTDVRGVEIAAAMVSVTLLALGLARGFGHGPATLGRLAAHGVGEAERVGVRLGARPETFRSLACVGDLVSAVAADERPELVLGRLLAEGRSLHDALSAVGTHIEGTDVCRRVHAWGAAHRVPTPFSTALTRGLSGVVGIAEAFEELLTA